MDLVCANIFNFSKRVIFFGLFGKYFVSGLNDYLKRKEKHYDTKRTPSLR